jgi:hypothetical protein
MILRMLTDINRYQRIVVKQFNIIRNPCAI